MKNRTNRSDFQSDLRAVTSQGRVSKSRVVVLEALEAQGAEGATIDELAQLIGQDMPGENPKMSIGSVLSRMQTEEHLVCLRNRWYLKEFEPQPKFEPAQTNHIVSFTNGSFQKIASVTQKRKGINISVYTSPRVYEGAVDISLLIGGRWWPVPLFGNARICIGQSRPEWSPNERYYTDVEIVKIVQAGGKVSEEKPAPRDIVTIDQAE
jgi:hypothetical protein